MIPSEIVNAFMELAARCLEALITSYEGTDRPTVWTGLLVRPRGGGDPVRAAELEGLGTFQLHGRGCQFEMKSGADVDIDWDDEGRVIFDSWRVWIYARSVGAGSVDQESLRKAMSEESSLLQLGPDTFTWLDNRYEIARGPRV